MEVERIKIKCNIKNFGCTFVINGRTIRIVNYFKNKNHSYSVSCDFLLFRFHFKLIKIINDL